MDPLRMPLARSKASIRVQEDDGSNDRGRCSPSCRRLHPPAHALFPRPFHGICLFCFLLLLVTYSFAGQIYFLSSQDTTMYSTLCPRNRCCFFFSRAIASCLGFAVVIVLWRRRHLCKIRRLVGGGEEEKWPSKRWGGEGCGCFPGSFLRV